MGAQSILLLEGAEHLQRRRLMLPPFHGERLRAYESTIEEITEREIATWPTEQPLALHPRMQAITLEVILRTVFGVTDPVRRRALSESLPRLVNSTGSAGVQLRVLLARRVGRPGPLADLAVIVREIDELLLAEIAQRRARPPTSVNATTSCRCSSPPASRTARA